MHAMQPSCGTRLCDTQAGLASWEEPRLPLAAQLRQQWRLLLVHLWGPAGSLAFHAVAVAALFSFGPVADRAYGPPDILDLVPSPPVQDPLPEPPAPTTVTRDVPRPPDLPAQPDTDAYQDGRSLIGEITDTASGGSGTQPDGDGLGNGPSSLTDKGFQISDKVMGRLRMIGLTAGETAGGRRDRLKKYIAGDTPSARANEAAVLCSLRWLKREQQPDGSWKGSKRNVPPAMTSLALLAFLAHGETPDAPEFGPTVKRGVQWLLDNQESDGRFKGRDEHDYAQPIAAYALCEAYSMTGHQRVREAAARAVTLIVKGQHASGGFNYNLDTSARNDSSYMAWCCQALKAAKAAKLEDDIPGLVAAIKKGVAGFRLNADPAGGFGYTGAGRTGLSGAGALCMQLLGAPEAPEVVNTLKFLEACTFSFATPDQQPYGGGSQLYYWYYITQAKFNHGKSMFTPWDRQFAPELRRTMQLEKGAVTGPDGKPADVGHWESPVKGEHSGGAVQDTALCTLMLEVYYRYLSTSQHTDADPEMAAGSVKADEVGNVRIR
jgi:hypothetical protein